VFLDVYLKDVYSTPSVDPQLSEPMLSVLRWNGQRNPLSVAQLKERVPGFADYFERALSYSYLIILRIRTPTGGSTTDAEAEAHVFDLQFVRSLGNVRFPISAFPDDAEAQVKWRNDLRRTLEIALTPSPVRRGPGTEG
jgi:hypothetical protein